MRRVWSILSLAFLIVLNISCIVFNVYLYSVSSCLVFINARRLVELWLISTIIPVISLYPLILILSSRDVDRTVKVLGLVLTIILMLSTSSAWLDRPIYTPLKAICVKVGISKCTFRLIEEKCGVKHLPILGSYIDVCSCSRR